MAQRSILNRGAATPLAALVLAAAAWGLAAPGQSALAQASPAAPAAPASGEAAAPPAGLPRVRAGQAIEAYVAEAMRPLRRADLTGEGLSAETIGLDSKWARARARAAYLGRIYRYDLDGDGRIARSEVMQSIADQRNLSPDRTMSVRRMVEREMQADADGDRVITFDEARAHGERIGTPELRRLTGLLQFDADGDGVVTPAELEAAARAEFAKADVDGNGLIGREEFRTLRAAERGERPERMGPGSGEDGEDADAAPPADASPSVPVPADAPAAVP
ncbi:hypothetical protein [Zavarzinia sp. CC-PAN008]|uniref:hypothetical protein n=1 Tax=Zavarzinia sp. CC-PAN008 TaxID=3243332 RepID=UPI003F748C6D